MIRCTIHYRNSIMADDTKNLSDSVATLSAIAFKPKAFVPHDPEVWFASLELQFDARRVTSQRHKFTYAVEAIPGDILPSIRDLILNPPEHDPYDKLKETLLKRFTPSREEKLRQLLARHPIGDTKPSLHLAHLRSLAGPTDRDSEIVKELWIEALPVHLQATITALLEDSSLDRAASIADKVVARVGSGDTPLVASTSQQPYEVDLDQSPRRTPAPRRRNVQRRLSFKDRVDIPSPVAHRSRSRAKRQTAPQRARSKSLATKANGPEAGYCWFHQTYKAKARNCRKPCSFVTGNA